MLTKQSLTRQAFDALVQKIVDDDIRPGGSLPSTAELVEEFGISRPVVREALSALQACGFVELHNGRPPVVAELDGQLIQMFVARAAHLETAPMTKLMEVRLPLEAQAARLAARRISDEELQRITELCEQMKAQLKDSASYPVLDVAFHAEIAVAAANQVLLWMIHSVRSELMTVMHAVRAHRDKHGLVGQEQAQHEAIFQAIRAGDQDEAERAMRTHLATSLELVRELETTAGPNAAQPVPTSVPPPQ
jgi:Transcriptional regulators